ncbi:beta strand repeat-containing protein [Tundrisphaera sp. TA3]|uniref:beta strand repeat-containing protein n=1 Tax=Tundrisphaera sp. TA3 TaxID=3435775 RepID=UPI003EC0D87B
MRAQNRCGRSGRDRNRRRAGFEAMESRELLATFTVASTQDSGPGSLRQAILDANLAPGADRVVFAIPATDPGFRPASGGVPASWTFRPFSALPTIERDPSTPAVPNPLEIDGTSQPGYAGRPILQIDGTFAGVGVSGLTITAGDSTVRGLAINQFQFAVGASGLRFGGNGIEISRNGGNLIQGNYLGPDLGATNRVGNGRTGLLIDNSPNNLVGGTGPGQGNIISSNRAGGLFITGAGASGNVVQGNAIGTNFESNPAADIANLIDGVEINSASGNTIGGTAPGAGNVIARNNGNGVSIRETTATGNVVQGNFIGTDRAGSVALGNLLDGVYIEGGQNNIIGGTAPGAGNVIGRNRIGVDIQPSLNNRGVPTADATGNLVQGNHVGLFPGPEGVASRLDNLTDGIALGGSRNLIGGLAPGAGNVISRNGANGISVAGRNLATGGRIGVGNVIQGNRIGTESGGADRFANAQAGIVINASDSNQIGPGNLISGNGAEGILILQAQATGNVVAGNRIGTDASGTAAIGNGGAGLRIADAGSNLVGGTTAAARNLISGNQGAGVAIAGAAARGNRVVGNFVGTDLTGRLALGNRQDGVNLAASATANAVGGPGAGESNLISGNLGNGIAIIGGGAGANLIQGNDIGVDVAGSTRLGNSGNGILVDGSAGNLIGGAAPGAGNLISGNQFNGIFVSGAAATGNEIQGNLIGVDATGMRGADLAGGPLGNVGNGILLSDAPANRIGGSLPGQRNIISANLAAGIQIFNVGASGNQVQGNFLGTNREGTAALPNLTEGILINFAPGNLIGGTDPASGNLVSGNQGVGVRIQGAGASGNVLAANRIGLDASGRSALQNGLSGVLIDGAAGNAIGIAAAGAGNVISGNAGSGIQINGPSNLVQNNVIGTDVAGGLAVANQIHGIAINGAAGNLIGGPGALAGNLISGNGQDGIFVTGVASSSSGAIDPPVVIQGNTIGTDASGTFAVPNRASGILIEATGSAQVGGDVPGAGNLVSGNGGPGVALSGAASTGNRISGNRIGTDRVGGSPIGNSVGVLLSGSPGNLVGGESAAARNLISGNRQAGIQVVGFGASANRIRGNWIGIDAESRIPLSNGIGVLIDGVGENQVGGPEPGAGNVISGNDTTGIYIIGQEATANVAAGNIIGLDATGRFMIATSDSADPDAAIRARQDVGVLINGSVGNVIGGVAPNIISGNVVGVELSSLNANLAASARPNRVLGNLIGTDATGLSPVGNLYGVFINGLSDNVIGGPGAGNVISGNTAVGVEIFGALSAGNLVQSNLIGPGADGRAAFVTPGRGGRFVQPIGIGIQDASGNRVGGRAAGEGNTIAGNDQAGIYILGQSNSSRGNVVVGNVIGIRSRGKKALGNRLYGVLLFNAPDNSVARSGRGANRFAANGIADFREFTGRRRDGGAAASTGDLATAVARVVGMAPSRKKPR